MRYNKIKKTQILSAKEILYNELGKDWKIVWIKSGGGVFAHWNKEIWLNESYKNNYLGMLLHEIAHNKYADHKPQNAHGAKFADHFTALVTKYTKGL